MALSGALFGWMVLSIAGFLVIVLVILAFWVRRLHRAAPGPMLFRRQENPILSPSKEEPWENAAVFNPAAILAGGTVHLFYRALGGDGISRIGYARSEDGIHFERFPEPAFVMRAPASPRFKNPFADSILHYNPGLYASGGGWGGSEDPRAVLIDGIVYLLFGVFESWESMRVALTSLPLADVEKRAWRWAEHSFISPPGETNKNWVMFPEKIHGKFAILHALTPKVMVDYVDSPEEWRERPVRSDNRRSGRKGHWDAFIRGAAAPPLRTKYGWLLLYHAMDPAQGPGYNVGAMLLDLEDPTKVLHRSESPVLEPVEWYENDWKPGVVYASGAIIKDDTLFVYYGGGDKTVSLATAPLEPFLQKLLLSSTHVHRQTQPRKSAHRSRERARVGGARDL